MWRKSTALVRNRWLLLGKGTSGMHLLRATNEITLIGISSMMTVAMQQLLQAERDAPPRLYTCVGYFAPTQLDIYLGPDNQLGELP